MDLNILEQADEMDGSLIEMGHCIAYGDWDRYFKNIVEKDESYDKFRQGCCCGYAASCYFVLMLRKVNFIPLYPPLFKLGGRFLKNRKKIIFIGAFLMLVDDVVDNIFSDCRKDRLHEVIFGSSPVEGKPELLRTISRKLVQMGADLRPMIEWAAAEEKNLKGVGDPAGLCFRQYGISYATDLLIWSINGSQREREMLGKAALLSQMVDDVLDMEQDRKNRINTPAIQGTWNEETIRETFIDLREAILSRIKNPKKAKQLERAINWNLNWLIETIESYS